LSAEKLNIVHLIGIVVALHLMMQRWFNFSTNIVATLWLVRQVQSTGNPCRYPSGQVKQRCSAPKYY